MTTIQDSRYCTACGAIIDPNLASCAACHAPQLQRCGHCATLSAADASFCFRCGRALSARTLPRAEVRLATVLFADLSGFTAMAERLSAEQTADLVNRCFDQLVARITAYEGHVDKFVGDAVMACFGAPIAHEDDPERAILAALGMQQALVDLNLELQRSVGMHIALRIGINTGEVLAGRVGGAGRYEYTVMGDTVNLASRLEHECRVGHVLVGERTYRHTAHAFTFRAMEPLQIRGKREPVQAFEVTAPRPQQQVEAHRTGSQLRLIGRQAELNALLAGLRHALAGSGSLLVVRGEAGIGKTRLLEEALRLQPVPTIMRVRAVSYGHTVTFGLLSSLLRILLQLENLEGASLRQALPEALAQLHGLEQVGDHAIDLDVIGEALDLPPGDSLAKGLEPRLRQRLLTQAVSRILQASMRGHGGAVLVLEDIHWGDAASMAVIAEALGAGLASLPLLVVALERTEGISMIPGSLPHQEVLLLRLSPIELQRFVRDRLGYGHVPESLFAMFLERSDGNPYFAGELIASLQETGSLVLAHGRWELEERGAAVLPTTVLGLLQARLDRLSAEGRRIVQVAAVIGRTVPRRLLALSSGAGLHFERALSELAQGNLLQPAVHQDHELYFAQSLIQEAAYANLPTTQRRLLHGQVGEHIVALEGEGAPLDVLAYHFERSDDLQSAVRYLWLAAQRDRSLYANDSAHSRLLRCLDLLENLSSSPPIAPAAVQEALGDLERLAGRYNAATERYQQALADTRGGGESPGHHPDTLSLTLKLADALLRRALYEQVWQVLATLETPKTSVDLARVRLLEGQVALAEGRIEEAASTFQTCLDLLVGVPAPDFLAQLYIRLGNLRAQHAQYEQAARYYEQAMAVSRERNDARGEAAAHRELGGALAYLQRWQESGTTFEHAICLCEKIGDRGEMARALADYAASMTLQGHWLEAQHMYRQAMALFEQERHMQWVARVTSNLARLYLDMGHPERALSLAQRGVELYRSIGHRAGIAVALINLAEALQQTRVYAAAEQAVTEAAVLCAESGMSFLNGPIALARAELHLLREESDALILARQALDLTQQSTYPLDKIKAWRLLGRVSIQQGLWDEAAASLHTSLDLALTTGNCFQQALTELELARVLQHYGQHAEADRLLTQAQHVRERLDETSPATVFAMH